MFSDPALVSMLVFLLVFGAVLGISVLVFVWLFTDRRRTVARLRALSDDNAPVEQEKPAKIAAALPKAGNLIMPTKASQVSFWRQRLAQAGYYGPHALAIFLGVKLVLLLVLPLAGVLVPWTLGWLSPNQAMIGGMVATALGFFGPNYWLDWQGAQRLRRLRCALPDAMDMLVLCLEGGASLPAALQRVNDELPFVHPELAGEMNIVQRELDMGASPGEAFQRFAERTRLDDLRELAFVLLQSEKYGASVAKSIRLHADTWRLERQQRAEEQAQKASVKILFPMLLCIFPTIFLVTLGPAAVHLARLFSR
ncbi:MAG: type II secretion system F family protein [Gemmataceae bacterium]|nr:type II secretion system F family protein [Gemmataceae bacterium]MCI0739982.1 type II secretion system F family protein [Gemmataceae bacterium]